MNLKLLEDFFGPCSHLILEKESREYAGCRFELSNKKIVFRTAKITPTKNGQFVTLWKRSAAGPIEPFDVLDSIDLFVVEVCKNESVGFFIFPKEVLLAQGVVSKNGIGGKRAMRVYPPWDLPESQQASKSQKWQTTYFAEMISDSNNSKIKKLFSGD